MAKPTYPKMWRRKKKGAATKPPATDSKGKTQASRKSE